MSSTLGEFVNNSIGKDFSLGLMPSPLADIIMGDWMSGFDTIRFDNSLGSLSKTNLLQSLISDVHLGSVGRYVCPQYVPVSVLTNRVRTAIGLEELSSLSPQSYRNGMLLKGGFPWSE